MTERVKRHGLAGIFLATIGLVVLILVSCGSDLTAEEKNMASNSEFNELTPEEARVIIHKGTEAPFTGEYYKNHEAGLYLCRQCDAPLYRSDDKFDSGCGWPSFDDEIDGAVTRSVDADGRRTEITCNNCGGHLGHVFEGERFTEKNTRHCVNSISLKFVAADEVTAAMAKAAGMMDEGMMNDMASDAMMGSDGMAVTETAYFAGGCFWGTEHLLQQLDGVISVQSGYMGGGRAKPTYEQVCSGATGHAETVEVVYDPSKTDFETVARYFFEIHDPTQMNRQGPDVGNQYRSAVFYVDEMQKEITEKLIGLLKDKGYDVVTEVAKADTFWPAEGYHQDYYERKGSEPYCHFYQERF